MTDLRFAVVQHGAAVFGAGHTADEAIADAARWIEPKNGKQGGMSPDEVRAELVTDRIFGELRLISVDDDPEEFAEYLSENDTFVERDNKWYNISDTCGY